VLHEEYPLLRVGCGAQRVEVTAAERWRDEELDA